MGVGSTTGLHGGDLLGILDVRNVENSDAAEAVFLRDWEGMLFLLFFLFVGDFVFVVAALIFVGGVFILVLIFILAGIRGWRRFWWKSFDAAIQASIGHFD